MTDFSDFSDAGEFAEFVRWSREEVIRKMDDSAAVVHLAAPPDVDMDPVYALQIGASILLDKPIIIVRLPGRTVPAKLAAIADEIVDADVDSAAGAAAIKAALDRLPR